MAIAAIIPAVISLASAIGGSIASSNQAKKKDAQINSMLADNEAQYLQNYYNNSLDSPTSRSYLKRLDTDIEEQQEALRNNQIAGGSSSEAELAAKQRANEVKSDTIGNIVQMQETANQAAQAQYNANKAALQSGQLATYDQRAQNWQNLGSNIGDAAVNVGSLYLDGSMDNGLAKTPKSSSNTIPKSNSNTIPKSHPDTIPKTDIV